MSAEDRDSYKRKAEAKNLDIQDKKLGFIDFIQLEKKDSNNSNKKKYSSMQDTKMARDRAHPAPQFSKYLKASNTLNVIIDTDSSESDQCEIAKSQKQNEEDLQLKSPESPDFNKQFFTKNRLKSSRSSTFTRLNSMSSTTYSRNRMRVLKRALTHKSIGKGDYLEFMQSKLKIEKNAGNSSDKSHLTGSDPGMGEVRAK